MSSAACPGNFACDSHAAATCDTACTSSAQCATGFVCNAGACVPPTQVGPCTENDDCTTMRCGVGDGGGGHCCSTVCALTAPPCGASDCDGETGACAYPDVDTGCGTAQSCDGGIQTNADHCDGKGTCSPGSVSTACAPYICGADACQTRCGPDGGCAAGDACDVEQHMCCAGLQAGGSMAVDSILGDDAVACCGTPGKQPCQSITHAMVVVAAAQLRDVTLLATVDGGAGGWGSPTETYPILLGWGAELKAPGVGFGDPRWGPGANPNRIIFTIGRVSSNDDVGYASLVGTDTASNWLFILQPTNLMDIQVQSGSTLYLANVLIDNTVIGVPITGTGSAIDVAAGASLVLGADKAGAVTGTVELSSVYTGIECEGGEQGDLGCSVSDVPLNGASSLLIASDDVGTDTVNVGISAGDNTSISLKSAPNIGYELEPFGQLNCGLGPKPAPGVGQGVVLNGTASMTFENGRVGCIHNQAFYLEASPSGVPSLTLSNTLITETGLGVYASAGTAIISGSIFQDNGGGVEQDTDGTNSATIDLSGGGVDGGGNVIVCSNKVWSAVAPGVSVLNRTSLPLNASNVSWDTSGPDVFECDAQLRNCACESSGCSAVPGSDSMDAVYESTGTITTTGNQLSPVVCRQVAYIGDSCLPLFMDCVLPWLVCCGPPDGGECETSCVAPG